METWLKAFSLVNTLIISNRQYAFVIVNIDCQLDRISNYLKDKFGDLPMRDYLEWVNWIWKTCSNCRTSKGKKGEHCSSASASWLQIQCHHLPSSSSFHDGLCPGTVNQSKPSFHWVCCLLLRSFTTATREVTNTANTVKTILETLVPHSTNASAHSGKHSSNQEYLPTVTALSPAFPP